VSLPRRSGATCEFFLGIIHWFVFCLSDRRDAPAAAEINLMKLLRSCGSVLAGRGRRLRFVRRNTPPQRLYEIEQQTPEPLAALVKADADKMGTACGPRMNNPRFT